MNNLTERIDFWFFFSWKMKIFQQNGIFQKKLIVKVFQPPVKMTNIY